MAGRYEYKALDPSKKEIRVILLLSHEFSRSNGRGDEVICCLEHLPLDEVQKSYAALSYAWGAPGMMKEIKLLPEEGEAALMIRENLYDALFTLRLDDVDRYIWVDAICINQSDDIEKSSQVQLMGEVYQNAEATLIWLGNATAESDLAFDFMQNYAAEHWDREWETLLASVNTEDDFSATFPCDAMLHILSRPWFSRIWVVQEVSLASSVVFHCGKKVLDDFDVLLCTHLFYLTVDSLNRKDEKTEYETRLVNAPKCGRPMPIIHQLPGNSARQSRSFLRWFEECQTSNAPGNTVLQATDSRDLIFGLLGIASNAKASGIIADYTKSLQETFVDATKALILQGDLGILGFAQHPRASTDLPSWVPDWRTVPFKFPLLYSGMDAENSNSFVNVKGTCWEHEDYRPFSVSRTTSVLAVFTDSDTYGITLSLDAVILSGVSGVVTTRLDPAGITYNDIRDWVNQMMSLIELTECKVYLTEETQTNAIFQTFVTDRLLLPTAGRSSCRARSSHLKPMQDIIAELAKPEPDKAIFMAAHKRNTSPGTDLYDVSIRNIGSRVPFITEGGWIGLGPDHVQEGDKIIVPLGGKLPLALRPDGTGKYRFLGEVYIHGIMDGEIMQMGLPVTKVDIY